MRHCIATSQSWAGRIFAYLFSITLERGVRAIKNLPRQPFECLGSHAEVEFELRLCQIDFEKVPASEREQTNELSEANNRKRGRSGADTS